MKDKKTTINEVTLTIWAFGLVTGLATFGASMSTLLLTWLPVGLFAVFTILASIKIAHKKL